MGKAARVRWRHRVQALAFGGDEDHLHNTVSGFMLGGADFAPPLSIRDHDEAGILLALHPMKDVDDTLGAYDAWRPHMVKRSTEGRITNSSPLGTAVLLVVPETPGTFYWLFVGLNRMRVMSSGDVLRAVDPHGELHREDTARPKQVVQAMVANMTTMAAQRWPSWAPYGPHTDTP